MLKPDDLVLCTVKSIEGAAVFLEIESGEKGTLSLPEIAAGRIRNLREYVSPNKKIVCKVLRIHPDHIELSLRRVTAKEKESVLERNQKERTFTSLIKSVTKNPEEIIKKIKESQEISDFYDEIKENPKATEKFFSKSEAEKIVKILSEKKEKDKEIKKIISLKSYSDSGIEDIKEILKIDAEVKYLGSSKFSITTKAKEFKDANIKMQSLLDQITAKAKEKKAQLDIIEK